MNKQHYTQSLHVKTLILGGGITGLSVAYHLEKQHYTDYLLVEKNDFFGGLCASQEYQGFTFDYSGHLLHLHDAYALRLVRRLLRGNLLRHTRQAFIDFEGTRVPFPFQANLWALPAQIRRECIAAVQQALHRPKRPVKNFQQWCLHAFGEGIYRHFLKPYNTKLWQTNPARMTWDWCADFVPKPDVKQIVNGASRKPRLAYGYNAHFYYPKHGGCGALAQVLAAHIPNTWLNVNVQQIDLKNHCALINGRRVFFSHLVNTLPLPDLIKLCPGTPAAVKQAAQRLKCVPVHVFQFAVNRTVKPFHWIYFPQEQIPFFRVGLQSSFSPYNAPRGTSAFYVETTQPLKNAQAAQKAILNTLQQKGIIKKQDRILCSFWRTLSPGYAVYDFKRAAAQKQLVNWLHTKNCFCAGRYGLWEYSFIERNLLQGRDLARQLTRIDA